MTVSLVKDQDWHEIRAYWFGFAARQGIACTDACADFAEDRADKGIRRTHALGSAVDMLELLDVNDRIITERA